MRRIVLFAFIIMMTVCCFAEAKEYRLIYIDIEADKQSISAETIFSDPILREIYTATIQAISKDSKYDCFSFTTPVYYFNYFKGSGITISAGTLNDSQTKETMDKIQAIKKTIPAYMEMKTDCDLLFRVGDIVNFSELNARDFSGERVLIQNIDASIIAVWYRYDGISKYGLFQRVNE